MSCFLVWLDDTWPSLESIYESYSNASTIAVCRLLVADVDGDVTVVAIGSIDNASIFAEPGLVFKLTINQVTYIKY